MLSGLSYIYYIICLYSIYSCLASMMLSGLRSESAALCGVYILYFIYSGLASMMLSGLRSESAESLHSVEYIYYIIFHLLWSRFFLRHSHYK